MTAEFDTLQEKLFTANNHSMYEIGWQEILRELRQEIAEILRTQYGVEGVEAIHQVNEFERASNNFRCKVLQGGNETTVLLRKHITKKVTAQSISLVDRTLAYLRENDVAVPALIPTVYGTTACHDNDHFYQLFEFIGGTHYRGTHEELGDLARHLAGLHAVLARIPFADEIASKPTSWPAWSLDGWRDLFARAKAHDGYYDRLISGAESLILSEAAAYQHGALDQQQAKIQVIHGDLHPLNTIFENAKLKAFLDLGETRIAELLRDVGTALHRFVRQFIQYQGQDFWEDTLPTGLEVFICEYNKINRLTDAEILLLPLYTADELLRKLFDNIAFNYIQGDSRYLTDGELEKKLILLQEAALIRKELLEI